VRRERREDPLEAARQDGQRGEPGVRRRGDREAAARAQDAPGLRQQQLQVADVLDDLRAQDEVEGVVVQRQPRVGHERQRRRVREPPGGARQGDVRHVGQREPLRVEAQREAAVAATEVERRADRSEALDEARQMLGGIARVLRDHLPQLVVEPARHR
jgi:hypothetical protein